MQTGTDKDISENGKSRGKRKHSGDVKNDGLRHKARGVTAAEDNSLTLLSLNLFFFPVEELSVISPLMSSLSTVALCLRKCDQKQLFGCLFNSQNT